MYTIQLIRWGKGESGSGSRDPGPGATKTHRFVGNVPLNPKI